MVQNALPRSSSVILGEAQLILAERRTSLLLLRTGIAVFALPLAGLSVLIATSGYYAAREVLLFRLPLAALCGGVIILGTYLIIRALIRIRHQDQMIQALKKQNQALAEFLD